MKTLDICLQNLDFARYLLQIGRTRNDGSDCQRAYGRMSLKRFLKKNINILQLQMLDKMVPCVLIGPLDCFWEGSKLLGPFPSIVIP